MILQALVRYYQRLVEREIEGVAPYGYSPEKISYAILLSPKGDVVQVQDVRDTSGKKPLPRIVVVPQLSEGRTSGVKSNFLWDKSSYVLGVSANSKRADKEHAAFKALHEEALAGTSDPGLAALLAFLRNWAPEQFSPPFFTDDMLDANFVFRLDGKREYLHDQPAAKAIQEERTGHDESAQIHGMCLVSGDVRPLARLHPLIKGVKNSQPTGASIVAFNDDAYLL